MPNKFAAKSLLARSFSWPLEVTAERSHGAVESRAEQEKSFWRDVIPRPQRSEVRRRPSEGSDRNPSTRRSESERVGGNNKKSFAEALSKDTMENSAEGEKLAKIVSSSKNLRC